MNEVPNNLSYALHFPSVPFPLSSIPKRFTQRLAIQDDPVRCRLTRRKATIGKQGRCCLFSVGRQNDVNGDRDLDEGTENRDMKG